LPPVLPLPTCLTHNENSAPAPDIKADLVEYELDSNTKYACLSYTWGSSQLTTVFSILYGYSRLLEYEVIWGHIDILVVVVRRLSRRWKVKTLLAGPSPTSPMKAEITVSPISNRFDGVPERV